MARRRNENERRENEKEKKVRENGVLDCRRGREGGKEEEKEEKRRKTVSEGARNEFE